MVNKVTLIGRVGKEPEIRGGKVGIFSFATTDTWKDKMTGEKKTETQWHNIKVFREGLLKVFPYISTGKQLYIEGKVVYSQYEKDGVTKYSTEIEAQQIQLLGSKEDAPAKTEEPREKFQNEDDEIPF